MVVAAYHLQGWRGKPCGPELPTFHWALVELAFFTIVEEVMFYYSHRCGSTRTSLRRRLASNFNPSRQLEGNGGKVGRTRLFIAAIEGKETGCDGVFFFLFFVLNEKGN